MARVQNLWPKFSENHFSWSGPVKGHIVLSTRSFSNFLLGQHDPCGPLVHPQQYKYPNNTLADCKFISLSSPLLSRRVPNSLCCSSTLDLMLLPWSRQRLPAGLIYAALSVLDIPMTRGIQIKTPFTAYIGAVMGRQ